MDFFVIDLDDFEFVLLTFISDDVDEDGVSPPVRLFGGSLTKNPYSFPLTDVVACDSEEVGTCFVGRFIDDVDDDNDRVVGRLIPGEDDVGGLIVEELIISSEVSDI